MNAKYVKKFMPDLEEFREKTMKFHNKEMTIPEYKGFSGGFGSYAQRGGEKHMLRLRIAGGQITKERLKAIVDCCEKYQINRMKLTTCQSVQFHNMEASDVANAMEEMWNAGMISRGGGGDFTRNVMASPLSGVDKNEFFDVFPYAKAVEAYTMQFVKTEKLPRKLKIAFSNSEKNDTHATFRDLGFVAKANGTFDVYIAGGLGNNPRLGICVATDVEPSKVLYYVKAMIRTFVTYGNYEMRAKSRSRYMQESLGIDGLKKAYTEILQDVMEKESLDLTIEIPEVKKQPDGRIEESNRIIAQKQDGLYSVLYQPIGGNFTPETCMNLYNTIKDMDAVEIRVTPEEGMYMINCTAKEAQQIMEVTKDSAATLFETSVACIGNAICQVGARDSQALLAECIKAVREEHFADGVLPRIHISGCPSSCGTHQIGSIGFRGAVKQTPDGPKPAFAIFVGGCALQGKEVISEMGKSILMDEIPQFLVELGRMISLENTTYEEWIENHSDDLKQLIEKYTA